VTPADPKPRSTRTLGRRIVVLMLANGLSKLIQVGVEVFLGATAGAAQLGRYATMLSILLLAGLLAVVGTDVGVIRFLAIAQEDDDRPRLARSIQAALFLAIAFGALAGIALLLTRSWIAGTVLNKPEMTRALMWIALAIPLEALNQSAGAVFRGLRRERDYVITTDLLRSLVLAVAVVFPVVRNNVTALAVLLFVGTAGGALYGVGRLWLLEFRGKYRAADAELIPVIKQLLLFSLPVFLWNVIQQMTGQAQILISSAFLVSEDVGALNLLFRLILLFTFFQSAVNNTTAVDFSRLHHLGDIDQLRAVFLRVTYWLALVSLVIALPLIVQPEQIIGWIGPTFLAAASLAPILVAAQAINVGSGPIGKLLISCAYRADVLAISTVGAVLQIALSLWLIPRYGLRGAVITMAVLTLTLTLIRQIVAWRRLNIHAATPWLLALCAAGAGAALLVRWLREPIVSVVGFDLSGFLALLLALMISGVFALGWRRSSGLSSSV
jgi:O-antigen/teichoic acid export membrane protein